MCADFKFGLVDHGVSVRRSLDDAELRAVRGVRAVHVERQGDCKASALQHNEREFSLGWTRRTFQELVFLMPVDLGVDSHDGLDFRSILRRVERDLQHGLGLAKACFRQYRRPKILLFAHGNLVESDDRPALEVVDLGVPRIVVERQVFVDHETGIVAPRSGQNEFALTLRVVQAGDPTVGDDEGESSVGQGPGVSLLLHARLGEMGRRLFDGADTSLVCAEPGKLAVVGVDFIARQSERVNDSDRVRLGLVGENANGLVNQALGLCAAIRVDLKVVEHDRLNGSSGQTVVELGQHRVLPHLVQLAPGQLAH